MHTSPYAQAASNAIESTDVDRISREDIEQWLIGMLSESAGLDPQDIDVALPCSVYGLDSLTGVSLVGDLEVWLQVSLSPTLLWEMPSITAVAQAVVDELASSLDERPDGHGCDAAWTSGMPLDPETARQLLSQLPHLSDQDVATLLDEFAA